MKCTRCESQIVNRDNICPNCGADMNITAELINSAINKDNNAYTELYRRTYDDVYREIFVYVKNKDKIEDLVSETYIQAFRRLEQLNKPSSFLPWIRTIGRNKAIDVLRKKNPKVSIDSFDVLNEGCDEKGLRFEEKFADKNAKIPLDEIDKRETHRLMEEILDSIPEEQSCVVKMFYYDEMSIREIAEILGCSENTVKSRLSYGRNKIQQEVLALEKKGTKLYGLAPIPFFVFLIRFYNTIPVKPLSASVLASIESAVLGTTVASTVATTTATVATTASKGIALKVTAGIVAGVVAVSGGVIGGKKLYDNYKGNNATKPSTTVTQTMPTTVHTYNELSNDDIDYIKTLLSYTYRSPSNNYGKMTDTEMIKLFRSYYFGDSLFNGKKLLYTTSVDSESRVPDIDSIFQQVKVKQSNIQNFVKNVFDFDKNLTNNASLKNIKNVKYENGYYYFAIPLDMYTTDYDIKGIKYNKDKSKVIVKYKYYSEVSGEDLLEYTATFIRNDNNKEFPFRMLSNIVEYDGKVVDFGDYTLKVPNSWTYEKDTDGILFCEPKTKAKNGAGRIGWIRKGKIADVEKMEYDAIGRCQIIAKKNGYAYYFGGPQSSESYYVDGDTELSNFWLDIFRKAADLEKSVLTTFKLK